MPTSESHHNHRTSSPQAESSNRGPNNAVAETGSRRQSRKRGKNALQKETNTANDADLVGESEQRGSSTPVRVETADGTGLRPSSTRNEFARSAVLDALKSAEKVSDSDGSTSTGTWAQPMPFSRSPPTDLLESMSIGASPPIQSSAERGGFSSRTPPSSPPIRKSRPVSSNASAHPLQSRRSLSETLRIPSHPFGTSSPPLPHLPQPHFFGAPELDLGIGNRFSEGRSDSSMRFLSFANIPSTSFQRQKNRLDIVLLASEDRLDVVAQEKDKLAAIGALEGVGGTIIDAKVLTWESCLDPFHLMRPLMSLVVHGPKRKDHAPSTMPELASDKEKTAPGNTAAGSSSARANESTDFQTTVEIYSLATRQHLATLLWSQPSPGLPNIRGLPVSVPPPVGNLKLDACGNFMTVSSGTSGEIFVFGADIATARFHCIGKSWTSVQTLHDRRYSNSSNSTDPDTSPADMNRGGKFAPLPIMSLSSRWLAVVPPGPIASQSLPFTVELGSNSTIVPGLESHNAPPRPPVSCALESPDAESFINRVARGVAQEVVRGARWLGGQGLQTWNNYWNSRDQHMNTQSPAHNRNIYQSDSHLPAGVFPPTHAPESRPSSSEPQLVSIIDLQSLERESYAGNSDTVTPFATFQPPSGISFLSFSPDGLAILSATKKGDVQYVWDLKQCRYLKAGNLLTTSDSETSARSAKVMQLAKFARLTPSNIVDIEWKSPTGDRFAVVTKNGTIHVFDLPLSAFQWPSPRRSLHLVPSSAPTSPSVSAQPDDNTAAGSVFSSALKLAGKTQPILSNLRGRAPSIGMSNAVGSGNNTIGFASATGIRGSKVVAAGLSRSVGAATGTVNSLRHAGDNRLHLNSLARNPARSRVCWSQHREQQSLMVIDGQCIKSFSVSRRRASSKPGRQSLSVIDSNSSFSLSLPATEQLAALSGNAKSALPHESDSGEGSATGYWAYGKPSRPLQQTRIVHPLSCAEIETNAPYQPFHSDRRVNLFVYSNKFAGSTSTDEQGPWTFGDDIATTRLDIRPPTESDEEEQTSGASVLYRQTSVSSGEPTWNDEGMTGQVVVTTRRRKNKTPHQSMIGASMKAQEDDGFFEDDCDVLDFAEDRV